MIKRLLCRWFGWFCPKPPTPPIPPEPPIPPTEWVKVWICEDTQLLSRPDCRHGIHTEFEKGKEPTITCKMDHNPIPPQPVYPTFEEFSINWIGVLQWMYNNPTWSSSELIERSAQAGASHIHAFGWVGDPSPENAYTQLATPWKWTSSGKIDFEQKNPEYEKQTKRLMQECKDFSLDYRHILFMSRYNEHIFRSNLNVNGVVDFYTPKGFEYQQKYVGWVMRWYREVYGEDYKPSVLLMNEPAHYGDDASGHQIAEWHRDMGDFVLGSTVAEKMWIDSSHSEYAHAYFVGVQDCPKCGRKLGRAEYSHRPVRSESHGCSTKEGFIKNGYDHWVNSAWKHGVFNEDGSDSGSKLCDGISAFQQANTTELRKALTWAKSIQGDKQMYFVAFPFDPIKNTREDYSDVSNFDWGRLNVYKEIHNG